MKRVWLMMLMILTVTVIAYSHISDSPELIISPAEDSDYSDAWIGTWEIEYIDGHKAELWLNSKFELPLEYFHSWIITFEPSGMWRLNLHYSTSVGNTYNFGLSGKHDIEYNQYNLEPYIQESFLNSIPKKESKRCQIVIDLLLDNLSGEWYSKLNDHTNGLRTFGDITVRQ